MRTHGTEMTGASLARIVYLPPVDFMNRYRGLGCKPKVSFFIYAKFPTSIRSIREGLGTQDWQFAKNIKRRDKYMIYDK